MILQHFHVLSKDKTGCEEGEGLEDCSHRDEHHPTHDHSGDIKLTIDATYHTGMVRRNVALRQIKDVVISQILCSSKYFNAKHQCPIPSVACAHIARVSATIWDTAEVVVAPV